MLIEENILKQIEKVVKGTKIENNKEYNKIYFFTKNHENYLILNERLQLYSVKCYIKDNEIKKIMNILSKTKYKLYLIDKINCSIDSIRYFERTLNVEVNYYINNPLEFKNLIQEFISI